MNKILLAASAALLTAAPAAARDNSAYFGLEAGPLWAKDTPVEIDGEELVEINHKMGVDGDMIAGYDFGMFRLEAELAYKRSGHDEYSDEEESFDGDGRTSVYSGMINGMVDVGPDHDFAAYAGAGIGLAQVTHSVDDGDDAIRLRDRGLAWQLFAGVRKSVSQYFEVGAKYRYFNADAEDRIEDVDVEANYRSHALLFSLIHSFAARPRPVPVVPAVAAPPLPPPPPATQTCPDGTVILASDPCPLPPPPPPPPAPEPVRG
jgi:opacity protein-like surface antigen